jgi:hypothetical protein
MLADPIFHFSQFENKIKRSSALGDCAHYLKAMNMVNLVNIERWVVNAKTQGFDAFQCLIFQGAASDRPPANVHYVHQVHPIGATSSGSIGGLTSTSSASVVIPYRS